MSKRRSDPARQRFPGLSGALVVDSVRGRLRIRKWPRPRGRPKSPITRQQNEDFALRAFRTKYVAGSQMATAIDATKGTGLYPRDLIMRAMSVGLFDVVLPDGTVITHRRYQIVPVQFQGAILRPASNISFAAGAFVTVPWTLPVLDTAGFWDISQPTRLTIPNGVEVVDLSAGIKNAGSTGGRLIVAIRQNGSRWVGWDSQNSSGNQGGSATSGATAVVPGDYFEVLALVFNTSAIEGGGPSYFTINLLQAT